MKFQEKLNEFMMEKEKSNEFSGVVLIRHNGSDVFTGCYGYANRSFKVKNEINTRFRTASITKMFTAVSILQLIDEGKICLDTSAVEYLDLKNTKIPAEVTIHDLLTHTSGIADYFDEMNSEDEDWEKLWEEKPIYTMRSLLDYFSMFAYNEPVNKIGELFKYNGAGYILLGMIIEKASGMRYFDYVRKNVFAKAGMEKTDFISLEEVCDDVAEGYEPVEKDGKIVGWKSNIYLTTPSAASDGGAVSTAEDLMKFIDDLRKGKLLSSEMTQKILDPHVLDEDSNGARGYVWKYGYANWFILDDNDNIVRGGHPGEEYGVSARLYYYPSNGIDVVILANLGLCASSIGWQIHDFIMEEKELFLN